MPERTPVTQPELFIDGMPVEYSHFEMQRTPPLFTIRLRHGNWTDEFFAKSVTKTPTEIRVDVGRPEFDDGA